MFHLPLVCWGWVVYMAFLIVYIHSNVGLVLFWNFDGLGSTDTSKNVTRQVIDVIRYEHFFYNVSVHFFQDLVMLICSYLCFNLYIVDR